MIGVFVLAKHRYSIWERLVENRPFLVVVRDVFDLRRRTTVPRHRFLHLSIAKGKRVKELSSLPKIGRQRLYDLRLLCLVKAIYCLRRLVLVRTFRPFYFTQYISCYHVNMKFFKADRIRSSLSVVKSCPFLFWTYKKACPKCFKRVVQWRPPLVWMRLFQYSNRKGYLGFPINYFSFFFFFRDQVRQNQGVFFFFFSEGPPHNSQLKGGGAFRLSYFRFSVRLSFSSDGVNGGLFILAFVKAEKKTKNCCISVNDFYNPDTFFSCRN